MCQVAGPRSQGQAEEDPDPKTQTYGLSLVSSDSAARAQGYCLA